MNQHYQLLKASDPGFWPVNVPTDRQHKSHPNYLLVFLSLAVLTALEVGITYVPQFQAPTLLALSVFRAAGHHVLHAPAL